MAGFFDRYFGGNLVGCWPAGCAHGYRLKAYLGLACSYVGSHTGWAGRLCGCLPIYTGMQVAAYMASC